MINQKIMDRKKIAELCQSLKEQGKKIGFTSGSFDILHSGHASYLEKAKEKCDVLVVGVNSDNSVKKYKGEDRPIISETSRIKLIAALKSVDYTFLFDERRNKTNIETIKPDFYIKAGDYKESELTSAVYLKPWNGKAILISPEKGISSSDVIKKILKIYGKNNKESSDKESKSVTRQIKKLPAIFIDRDGVINKNVHFLHEPEKFEFLPGVIEGIKKLQDMHYRLIIVTNQQGIGLGYFTKEDFFKVNSKMLKEFSKSGISIDKIYFCPHSQSENCDCRKPKTGMFKRGKNELNVDMKRSFTIGDSESDVIAGKNSGTKTILISEKNKNNKSKDTKADYVAKNFSDAVDWIKEVESE